MHVALVQLGFVATEGFPQRKLLARPWTRWMVSTDARVAEGIVEVWRRRRPEAYLPRPYALVPLARVLLPGLYRRAVGGGAGAPAAPSEGAAPRPTPSPPGEAAGPVTPMRRWSPGCT